VGRLLARPPSAWWITIGYAAVLIVANVTFTAVAPQWFTGGEESRDLRNVLVRERVNVWAWEQLQMTPVLGIGHGSGLAGYTAGPGVHNHFLEQLLATGLLGGIPYLLFHAWILVAALRLLGNDRRVPHTIAAALAVSVTATYLAYQFFPGFFTSVFAVICGLLLGALREERAWATEAGG
jgi:O-antigen ligase